MLKTALAVVVLLILIVFRFVWFSGKRVDLKLAKAVPAIGTSTPVRVEADAGHGVKSFSAVTTRPKPLVAPTLFVGAATVTVGAAV